MRNRIIQVRHYSRKMMIMMLTGAICFSSCFCETAFAKTSKVRVYDAEKGTTSFTSFTYSDNKKDESLAPSEGTGAISSASQKAVIFHQADGSTIIRKADSNGKVTLPAIRNQTGYTFLGWSTKPDQTQNPQYQAGLFPKICSTPFPGSSLYILPVSFPWLPFLSGILSCSPAFAYLPIPSLITHLLDFITHDKFLQDILCFFYRTFSSSLFSLLVFHGV